MTHVLLIGSGAREHAIAKALSNATITCIGTSNNSGIKALSQTYHVADINDGQAILNLANNIDFAIIGPEAPLEKGVADVLWKAGIPVVGPKKAGAQIEALKVSPEI